MDCRTARLLLDFARPRCPELPADEAEALDAHLSGCAECDALSHADRVVDVRLSQVMSAVDIPIGLRDRIVARLVSDRGDRQRRRLGWTVRIAAAAAVVLLAVWAGFAWFGSRLRELDIERVHTEGYAKYTSPDRDKVANWFKEDFNLATVAPGGFDYRFFKDYGLASCQGQRVPSIFFARGDTEAHVFVISSDQFDLNALNEAQPIDSGGYRVEVVRDDPDHAFVILYKGESLRPLLVDGNSAQ
jgi:hypothetical protein